MDIAPLIRIVDARERTFDWAAIADGWGAVPPEDYVRFMRDIGPGELGDYFSIMAPTADLDAMRGVDAETLGDHPANSAATVDLGDVGVFDMAIETQDAQQTWETGMIPRKARLANAEPRLLCWAVSNDANQYCWDLADDSRPIVVFDRGFLEWNAYDLSFTDFLAGMIQDSIPNYAGDRIASHLGWEVPVTYKVHKNDRW